MHEQDARTNNKIKLSEKRGFESLIIIQQKQNPNQTTPT